MQAGGLLKPSRTRSVSHRACAGRNFGTVTLELLTFRVIYYFDNSLFEFARIRLGQGDQGKTVIECAARGSSAVGRVLPIVFDDRAVREFINSFYFIAFINR